MDAQHIAKNFNIKIPYILNPEYYIDLLSKSSEYSNLKNDIDEFNHSNITNKSKLRQLAIDRLKILFEQKFQLEDNAYVVYLEEKEFKPINGETYLSIDVREANWTISNYLLTNEKRTWFEYVVSEFDFPASLAKSKGLRQDIMGNVVNPRKFTRLQKYITKINLDKVLEFVSFDKIASINAEEIIINVGDDKDLVFNLKNIDYQVKTRKTLFKVDIEQNFGDNVIVKSFLDDDYNLLYKSLWKVDGHRFYLHFKTLILNEDLSEYDKIFKYENKYFEFCGKDFKDFKEYGYIEKHHKKLDVKHLGGGLYVFYLNKKTPLYSYSIGNMDFMALIPHKAIKLKNVDEWQKEIEKYHLKYVKKFFK